MMKTGFTAPWGRLLTGLLLLAAHGLASAGALAPGDVPAPLRPWVEWVLHGEDERLCPFLSGAADSRRCAWPSRLRLHLDESGGRFEQRWEVYAEGWVGLPGEAGRWPRQVAVDGEPARVTGADGRPRIRLAPGRHRVSGELAWERLPESLAIPQGSALVGLTLEGRAVAAPEVDREGRLWLGERPGARPEAGGEADALNVQVHRRVQDSIPLQVVTQVELEVSGRQREVVLGPALIAGHVPLALEGPLPARLEPDGRLRVQLRPGRWGMELVSRHPGPTTRVPLAETPDPWPDQEVWAFDARRHLRLVEVTGVTPVDPRQTRLPGQWRSLPAYRVAAGEAMVLEVVRRGDPEPEPDQLGLERRLWLDFDGAGYTVQDTLSGTMTRGWRLEAAPGLALGRVALDGRPRLITRLPDSPRQGVEVRRGALRMVADSRYEGAIGDLPAVGWDHDVQSLRVELNMPPGWRLFSATGMDNLPATWLQGWTLLDLFLVLIAALATQRLWGWRWGLVALVTLALIWHAQGGIGPPRYVWLSILAAVALLRVLPRGWLRTAVTGYRNLSLLALVLIAIPFAVSQVRLAVYPQLERGAPVQPLAGRAEGKGQVRQEAAPSALFDQAIGGAGSAVSPDRAPAPKGARPAPPPLTQVDPDARVQTGPGLPAWQWRQVTLSWNGPVDRRQRLGLVFLSPGVNLVLALLRVALVAVLALRMMGLTYTPGRGLHRGAAASGLLVLLVPLMLAAPRPAGADMPSPALLQELKGRLLAAPECLPACAEAQRMRLELAPDSLRLRMEVHAEATLAVPLPANGRHWVPELVLVDGEPAPALSRSADGGLWLVLEPGVHQVTLAGPAPGRERFQLPLALRPHQVVLEGEGWRVEGLSEDGLPDAQLQLTRVRPEPRAPEPEALEPGAMPTFVRVERTLHLGLDWRVESRVVRLSPAASGALVEVPLLPGESVLSEDARTRDGRVLVNMPPGVREWSWRSTLEKRSRLELQAAGTTRWHEVWRVDVSPRWHLETAGIPVVHHQDRHGRWLPEWRPWPGESVALTITRPRGVEGRTLTVDGAGLVLRPGRRATDATLTLVARSSQGGQHPLVLPEGAELQAVTIDGSAQPVRQEGRRVTLPLVPGRQSVTLDWRTREGLGVLYRSPRVELGLPSVNTTTRVELGRDRWTLLAGGPRLGPAVLFWSTLAVVVLVAAGLSRVPWTPLRFHHWLLLGIGLSQVPLWMAAVVVGWLLALGLRGHAEPPLRPVLFNLMQVGLVLLTVLALGYLFAAIQHGLLGQPEMQVAGNGSSAHDLRWYQDQAGEVLPRSWVLSLPLLVYRLLMLAWALWLAFALLRWLRWGWEAFSSHGAWRTVNLMDWLTSGRRAGREKPRPEPAADG